MTTMALDPPQRRLITGSDNGILKVWNFSSGACLKEMISLCIQDVTGVLHLLVQLNCALVPSTSVLLLLAGICARFQKTVYRSCHCCYAYGGELLKGTSCTKYPQKIEYRYLVYTRASDKVYYLGGVGQKVDILRGRQAEEGHICSAGASRTQRT
jgi:hypothetical protein